MMNSKAINQIDLEPLNSATNAQNISSQQKRDIDQGQNPLQTTKALSNASSKVQAT